MRKTGPTNFGPIVSCGLIFFGLTGLFCICGVIASTTDTDSIESKSTVAEQIQSSLESSDDFFQEETSQEVESKTENTSGEEDVIEDDGGTQLEGSKDVVEVSPDNEIEEIAQDTFVSDETVSQKNAVKKSYLIFRIFRFF